MPANAALYIPDGVPDLTTIFPGAKSDKGLFRKRPNWFTVPLNGDTVIFNVMPEVEIERHKASFVRYIRSLDEEDRRKADATLMVNMAKCVLALQTEREFEENHAIWQSLFKIADAFNGYVFTMDSLLLPNGAVIFGPLRDQG